MVVKLCVTAKMENVMSNLKNRIKEILDEYKTANMWSESVRDRITDELYQKLGNDDTHWDHRRYGWDDENE